MKTRGLSEEEKIEKYTLLISEWQELRNQGLSYTEIGNRYNANRKFKGGN